MGIGSFILIIACVVTLESRDKHTQVLQFSLLVITTSNPETLQVITEESMSFKRRRLMSIEERAELSMNEVAPGQESPAALDESDNQTTLNQFRYLAFL